MTKPRIYFKWEIWWVECRPMHISVAWLSFESACNDAYNIYWNNHD